MTTAKKNADGGGEVVCVYLARRCGAVRSEAVCDHNDRGVGLSPVARNTIRDSRLT